MPKETVCDQSCLAVDSSIAEFSLKLRERLNDAKRSVKPLSPLCATQEKQAGHKQKSIQNVAHLI